MVDLFIFDLDGTLVDSSQDITDSVNKTLNDHHLPPKHLHEIQSYMGDGVRMLIERAIGRENQHLLKPCLERYKYYHSRELVVKTTLYPNVKETLHKLKSIGKRCVVLTNKLHTYVEEILTKTEILHLFDDFIGDGYGMDKKPSPVGIFHFVDHFNVPHYRAAMVGDSIVDVQAGKNAGVKTVAFSYGYKSRDELERETPDYLFDDFSSLLNLVGSRITLIE